MSVYAPVGGVLCTTCTSQGPLTQFDQGRVGLISPSHRSTSCRKWSVLKKQTTILTNLKNGKIDYLDYHPLVYRNVLGRYVSSCSACSHPGTGVYVFRAKGGKTCSHYSCTRGLGQRSKSRRILSVANSITFRNK